MISRKLILIANNGTKSNYLPAVTLDIKHYRDYFKSPEGGAWEDEDIKFFDNNCTEASLHDYIHLRTGYIKVWQIVFCGHGYAKENGDSVLELSPDNDCEVSKIKSWLVGCCSLLITDSCRKICRNQNRVFDSVNESIQRRMFSETASPAYRAACRNIYLSEAYRPNSTYFAEGYACSLDECAHDDDQTGGFYSSALLHQACKEIESKKGGRRSILSQDKHIVGKFGAVHDQIIDVVNNISLHENGESQHPHRELGNQWPFYVIPSEKL